MPVRQPMGPVPAQHERALDLVGHDDETDSGVPRQAGDQAWEPAVDPLARQAHLLALHVDESEVPGAEHMEGVVVRNVGEG